MKLFIRIFLIYALLISAFGLWEEFAGEYYTKLKQFGRCRNMGSDKANFSTRLHKINRTHHAYSTNASLGFEMNDEGRVHALCANKGTNGRYNILLDVTGKTCEYMTRFANRFLEPLFEAGGLTYHCPIKKGMYYIKDWVINLNTFNEIPVFPYGDYRLELSFLAPENGKQVKQTCVAFFFEVRPLYEIKPNIKKVDPLLFEDLKNFKIARK